MKRRRNRLTTEQRAALRATLSELRADLGEIRGILEHVLDRLAHGEVAEARRKERLRRLTFGLLGRS
jgi:hypothetical protein